MITVNGNVAQITGGAAPYIPYLLADAEAFDYIDAAGLTGTGSTVIGGLYTVENARDFIKMMYRLFKDHDLLSPMVEGYLFVGDTESQYRLNMKSIASDLSFYNHTSNQIDARGWRSRNKTATGLSSDTNLSPNDYTFAQFTSQRFIGSGEGEIGFRSGNNSRQFLLNQTFSTGLNFTDYISGAGPTSSRISGAGGLGFNAVSVSATAANMIIRNVVSSVVKANTTATFPPAQKVGFGNASNGLAPLQAPDVLFNGQYFATSADNIHGFMGIFTYMAPQKLITLSQIVTYCMGIINRKS